MAHKRHIIALALALTAAWPLAAQKELGKLNTTVKPATEARTATPHLSAGGALLLGELEGLGRDVRRGDTALIRRYALVRRGCRYHVPATVVLAEGHSEAELRKMGVKMGKARGGRLGVFIPTRRLAKLAASGAVSELDISLGIGLK